MASSEAHSWSQWVSHKNTPPSLLILHLQAFKHIFTSPSSVDQEPKATQSGNVRIHSMMWVTPASITYLATQVSCVNFSVY